MDGATARRSARQSLAVASLAVTTLLAAVSDIAVAQNLQTDNSAAARAGAVAHAHLSSSRSWKSQSHPRDWSSRSRSAM